MKTVEFADPAGNPIGTITLTDTGELRADPWLASVADSWLKQGHKPAEFPTFYDGWSNGQVTAHTRVEETPMAKAPKLGSGKRFAALKAKLAARGDVADPGAVAASIGRKKYGPSKFAKLGAKAARNAGSK